MPSSPSVYTMIHYCGCCQPKVIGMCSLPLKSILQADSLFLDTSLEMKDRSRAADHNSSMTADNGWPVVGHLKVRIEPCQIVSTVILQAA